MAKSKKNFTPELDFLTNKDNSTPEKTTDTTHQNYTPILHTEKDVLNNTPILNTENKHQDRTPILNTVQVTIKTKEPKQTGRINLVIDYDMLEKFNAICDKLDTKRNHVINEFISSFVDANKNLLD